MKHNSIGTPNQVFSSKEYTLFCMLSFINHSKKNNVMPEFIAANVALVFASQDIAKGDEICFDYANGLDDTKMRNKMLGKFGICETGD